MAQPPSENWNKDHIVLLRKKYWAERRKRKRVRFSYSPFSIHSLAEDYGVAYTTMRYALTEKTWKK